MSIIVTSTLSVLQSTIFADPCPFVTTYRAEPHRLSTPSGATVAQDPSGHERTFSERRGRHRSHILPSSDIWGFRCP